MTDLQWITTQNIVKGDVIRFRERVFSGTFRTGTKYLGMREVTGQISKRARTLYNVVVVASSGIEQLPEGVSVTRKLRNILRYGCERLPWADEAQRQALLDATLDGAPAPVQGGKNYY